MIKNLVAETGASAWAIAAMFFFMAVFAVVVFRVLRQKKGAYDREARLPLDDGVPQSRGSESPSTGE